MIREELKLENQLCFRIHRLSRMFIKLYQPLLRELNITYPQYLVMLMMWEKESIDYQELADVLGYQTGTLTPIIQRLVSMKMIQKEKNPRDKRRTTVFLGPEGILAKQKVEKILDSQEMIDFFENQNDDKYEKYGRVIDEMIHDISEISLRGNPGI